MDDIQEFNSYIQQLQRKVDDCNTQKRIYTATLHKSLPLLGINAIENIDLDKLIELKESLLEEKNLLALEIDKITKELTELRAEFEHISGST